MFKRIKTKVLSGLWFVPLMYALAGLIVSTVTITIDRRTQYEFVPVSLIGGPDASLAVLGTVAASMVGLIGTVLAITMVVVQLAMAQFSPRIVQTFLQDKPSQNAIGLFVATFVVSMLSMREVLVSEDEPVVPGLSVLVTFVMVVIVIVVLVTYIHHIGQALRVSALIELVGSNTRTLTDTMFPDEVSNLDEPTDPSVLRAQKPGVLMMVMHEELVAAARDSNAVITVVPALGEFVVYGAPLVRIEGATSAEIDEKRVRMGLVLGLERTLDQDVAFGLRMLVDMGLRALADNPLADPTTAVQVIDRLHDILRTLSRRVLPDGKHYDDEGALRLVVPTMEWEAYVRLAFEELRLAGTESPQVTRRMRAALEDLIESAPADRDGPLVEQLDLLDARIARLTEADWDLGFAKQADPHGIGVRAGARDV